MRQPAGRQLDHRRIGGADGVGVGGNSMPGATRITRCRWPERHHRQQCELPGTLYGASPTLANGDGGAHPQSGREHLGSIDVASMRPSRPDAARGAAAAGSEFLLRLPAGTTIFALIEARAVYAGRERASPSRSRPWTTLMGGIAVENHAQGRRSYRPPLSGLPGHHRAQQVAALDPKERLGPPRRQHPQQHSPQSGCWRRRPVYWHAGPRVGKFLKKKLNDPDWRLADG